MNMTPELFLDCIILLIHNNGPRNKTVIKELISIYEKSARRGTSQGEENDSLLNFYMRVIKRLLSEDFDPTNQHEVKRYLLYMKSDVTMEKRKDLHELLTDILINRDDMSVDKLEEITKNIQNHLVWNRMNLATRRLFGKLGGVMETGTIKDQTRSINGLMSEMRESIEECSKEVTIDQTSSTVDSVNFSDSKSILEASKKHEKRSNADGFTLGLQGLSRMFGKEKRVRRGESVLFSALTHNYKSGLLQSVAMWLTTYNYPVIEGDKKPMILMISLENEAFQNYLWIVSKLYRQKTGNNPLDIPKEELANWAHQEFAKSGYNLQILRYHPNEFGYEELISCVNHYKSISYDVHAVIIDYLSLGRKHERGASGTSRAANHLAIKELYSNVCNYLKTEGITFFTAHQLNRKAQELANTGKTNVVRYFNMEHLADSADVEREIDTSIYMNIEKNHEGHRFLTLHRNKRRYDDHTPESHKYTAYPFLEGIGIRDDILDMTGGFIKNIYSNSLDTKSEENANTSLPPTDIRSDIKNESKPVEIIF